MGNNLLSTNLEPAALSDPRNYRLVFMYYKQGKCVLEVQSCFDVGDLNYSLNAETSNILCTNPNTGKDEVVGVIESGATQEVTFDLTRFLPQSKLSELLRLSRENCGLRVYLLRGGRCYNPADVMEFDVMDIIGEIRFTGDYSRSQLISKSISEAAEVTESTSVTGYSLWEIGKQSWAIRGGATVDAIADLIWCDSPSCGGFCQDDSDGCQVAFWIDELGSVWYTTDQFITESLANQVTGWVAADVITSINCVSDQVVVTGYDALGVGKVWSTDQSTILSGDAPVWTLTTQSVLELTFTDLPEIYDAHTDSNASLWLVGESGSAFQYDPISGRVTAITTVPNLLDNYTEIDIGGQRYLIGGTEGLLVTSADGGRAFNVVTIVDPATGVALVAGVNILGVSVIEYDSWEITLSDERILFTRDEGDTWALHIQPTGISGDRNDVQYNEQQIGYVVTADGHIIRTLYSLCSYYRKLPSGTGELPEGISLRKVHPCLHDPNVVVATGEAAGGGGIILVGTVEYA